MTALGQHLTSVVLLLRDELEIAMALTGCRTFADAVPHILRK